MTTTPAELVAEGEHLLQEWLQKKPPPVYLLRILSRPQGQGSDELWDRLLQLMGSDNEYMRLVDATRVWDDATVGKLNTQVYGNRLSIVRAAEGKFQAAMTLCAEDPASPWHAAATEGWAYAVTEGSVMWARTTRPNDRLDPAAPEFARAAQACSLALDLTQRTRDYFRTHRASYNLGRVLYELGYPPEQIRLLLRTSLNALEYHLAMIGEPADSSWRDRREDLLHRLILVCSKEGSTDAGMELHISTQYLKDVDLARKVATQADRQGRDIGQIILKVTGLKGGHEVPLPLMFDMAELCSRLPATTAVVEYVLTHQYAVVIYTHGSGEGVNVFRRDRCPLGALDVFLRPGTADFYGTTKVEPDTPSGSGGRAIVVDLARFVGGRDESRLAWELRQDTVELRPLLDGDWSVSSGKESARLDGGVDWQRTLYRVFLEPLERRLSLDQIEHLVVIPDMALMMLPFHLLADASGACLFERTRVSYANNLTVLASALSRPTSTERDGPVLIVSDPSKTLRWADWEVERVRRSVGRAAIVLDRSSASRDNVVAAMRDAVAVHFCTHGYFCPEKPEESGLLLKDGQWLTFDDIGRLDGMPSLVFLGACRTGRLRLSSRFQSTGLAAQFLAAGARTVVSALWEVSDLATALVSAEFYRNAYELKMPRLQSLGQAMAAVRDMTASDVDHRLGGAAAGNGSDLRRPFEHFFYWGGFSLHGAWD